MSELFHKILLPWENGPTEHSNIILTCFLHWIEELKRTGQFGLGSQTMGTMSDTERALRISLQTDRLVGALLICQAGFPFPFLSSKFHPGNKLSSAPLPLTPSWVFTDGSCPHWHLSEWLYDVQSVLSKMERKRIDILLSIKKQTQISLISSHFIPQTLLWETLFFSC